MAQPVRAAGMLWRRAEGVRSVARSTDALGEGWDKRGRAPEQHRSLQQQAATGGGTVGPGPGHGAVRRNRLKCSSSGSDASPATTRECSGGPKSTSSSSVGRRVGAAVRSG